MTLRRTARRLLRHERPSLTAADEARVQDLLSPGRCVLLVVDVQNDFVHPNGRIGPGDASHGYAAAVAAINRLIVAARTVGVPVVYIRTEHGPDLDSMAYRAVRARRPRSPEGACLAGTWGAEPAADLERPRDGDAVVTKHGYDGFASAELMPLVTAAGCDTVVVTGVATTLCLPATVAGAFEHGLFAIVPREATAAWDARAARAALAQIDRHYGEVVSLAAVLDSWRKAAARSAHE